MCISCSAAVKLVFCFRKIMYCKCSRSSVPLEDEKTFLLSFIWKTILEKHVALNINFLFLMLKIYDFLQVLIKIKISSSHFLVHWNTCKVLFQPWHIWLLKRNKKPYFPCQILRCMVLEWIYMLLPMQEKGENYMLRYWNF